MERVIPYADRAAELERVDACVANDLRMLAVQIGLPLAKDAASKKYVAAMLDRLERDKPALAAVGAAEGKRTYGDRYRSLDDFVALHLELAADRVDDHMHDGLGFLTMHVALTSFFERGLQAVNPAVAVPYWDYTRDDAKFKAAYGARTPLDARFWSLDDLWSDDWFGGAENGFHTVTSGRFAYQRVPKATADHVANPYGFLRAPWNANARPFVTRVHQLCGADALSGFGWPSCGTHHNLTFETTSYYDWACRA